jgi:hypothetical protein
MLSGENLVVSVQALFKRCLVSVITAFWVENDLECKGVKSGAWSSPRTAVISISNVSSYLRSAQPFS